MTEQEFLEVCKTYVVEEVERERDSIAKRIDPSPASGYLSLLARDYHLRPLWRFWYRGTRLTSLNYEDLLILCAYLLLQRWKRQNAKLGSSVEPVGEDDSVDPLEQ